MSNTILKIFTAILLLIAIIVLNMWVFRSDTPMLWLVTFIGSVIFLIKFPYNKLIK